MQSLSYTFYIAVRRFQPRLFAGRTYQGQHMVAIQIKGDIVQHILITVGEADVPELYLRHLAVFGDLDFTSKAVQKTAFRYSNGVCPMICRKAEENLPGFSYPTKPPISATLLVES